jgi:hypothetical protein
VIVLLGSTVRDAFKAHCSSRRGLDAITDFPSLFRTGRPFQNRGGGGFIGWSEQPNRMFICALRKHDCRPPGGNEALKQLLTDFPA